MSVKRLSLELCTGVKDNVDLVWFMGVINTMMRYVPNTGTLSASLSVVNSLSLSFVNHLLHEGFVMIPILSISLQPLFEPF